MAPTQPSPLSHTPATSRTIRDVRDGDLKWIVAQARELDDLKERQFVRDGRSYDSMLKKVVERA